ncbi:zinc finger BED domain-containing protein RICESLEEPER 2 [Tanacetum coccineum]
MSASTKPLAHLFFGEILDIDTHLRKWQAKPAFKVMATKMRSKYEQYWGNLLEINDFMYFAVLLDPTMKSQLIAHGFRKIIRYDITPENPISNKDLEQMVSNMVDEVQERMGVLFEMCKERCGFHSSSSGMCESMQHEATSPSHGDNDFYNGNDTSSIEPETELQRYLKEPKVELRKGQIFDILQWWKVNGPRFPIVARMARDILAIQISIVASKSAFSTGGRVLDPYRTSLSTKIVEALICTAFNVSENTLNCFKMRGFGILLEACIKADIKHDIGAYLPLGTDIAKITRKWSKPDKHEHGNG